jgi:Domain of unknown function (DUF4874)/Domain of unknown function (DUF4832)
VEDVMLRLVGFLILFAWPAFADGRVIRFGPTDVDMANPERGWWVFVAEDFASATESEIAGVAAEGVTVAYGIVRLDAYRDSDLPGQLSDALDQRFAWARAHGLKIILRFAYNYPDSSSDYEQARDASLPRVLGHIATLGPTITRNADTIVALQAGFIGAWGEGHTSSNGLDTPAAKAAIRDALYAAVPDSVPLQWRYPADVMSWPGDTRMGFHNDCFLSSPTDVGTFDENADLRGRQRAAMMALTDDHYFSGETCDADADAIRAGCNAITDEGVAFHLSALHRDYYKAFHRGWKTQGCYREVSRNLGYRLRLVAAEIGENGTVRIRIANDGWARPVQARKVILTAYAGDAVLGETVLSGTLADVGAGAEMWFSATMPEAGEADHLCLSAPDTSARLQNNVAYAVRFANAETNDQGWNAETGAFCFR